MATSRVKHPGGPPPPTPPTEPTGPIARLRQEVFETAAALTRPITEPLKHPNVARFLSSAAEAVQTLVGHAKYTALSKPFKKLEADSRPLPAVLRQRLMELAPELTQYDATLNYDVLAQQLDRESQVLAPLIAAHQTLMGDGSATEKRIAFLTLANHLFGVSGKKPEDCHPEELARGHYAIDTDALHHMIGLTPHGKSSVREWQFVPHATARERMLMMLGDETSPDQRRAAATVYEYYLVQRERHEQRRAWWPLLESRDLGVRVAADKAIVQIPTGPTHELSDFATIPKIVAQYTPFAETYPKMAALAQLREIEDQITTGKEIIQDYSPTGERKGVEEKFWYQLTGGMIQRVQELSKKNKSDPLGLDATLDGIRQAKAEIHAGNFKRYENILNAVEKTKLIPQIQELQEEAVEKMLLRDMMREGVCFAAATVATAGVGTAIELLGAAAKSAETAAIIATAANTVKRLSQLKRLQQLARPYARAAVQRLATPFARAAARTVGEAIVKQNTFLHTKAAAELAVTGHQSLYDSNQSISQNLFNLGVGILEFELMGRFHKVFKEMWVVKPMAARASWLGKKAEWLRHKSHELIRDSVFFHLWSPAAGALKTVAHGDRKHLQESVDNFFTVEGAMHTAMMTVAMGAGFGTPAAQRVSRAVQRARVKEVRQVEAQQREIQKLEEQIQAIKPQTAQDLNLIAELRTQQSELTVKNAELMDAAAARHPKSEALREQAKQLHLAANHHYLVQRHAEQLRDLAQMDVTQSGQRDLFLRAHGLDARLHHLADISETVERRLTLVEEMFANGAASAQDLGHARDHLRHLTLEFDILANLDALSQATHIWETVTLDITPDKIAELATDLLTHFQQQRYLILESQKLPYKRFRPEVLRKADTAIRFLTHMVAHPKTVRETGQRYFDMLREIYTSMDEAIFVRITLSQEKERLGDIIVAHERRKNRLIAEARQQMWSRHRVVARYAERLKESTSIQDAVKRHAQLENHLLDAAKDDKGAAETLRAILTTAEERMEAMRLYLNSSDPELRAKLEQRLVRSDMEVQRLVEDLIRQNPKHQPLNDLLPPLSPRLLSQGPLVTNYTGIPEGWMDDVLRRAHRAGTEVKTVLERLRGTPRPGPLPRINYTYLLGPEVVQTWDNPVTELGFGEREEVISTIRGADSDATEAKESIANADTTPELEIRVASGNPVKIALPPHAHFDLGTPAGVAPIRVALSVAADRSAAELRQAQDLRHDQLRRWVDREILPLSEEEQRARIDVFVATESRRLDEMIAYLQNPLEPADVVRIERGYTVAQELIDALEAAAARHTIVEPTWTGREVLARHARDQFKPLAAKIDAITQRLNELAGTQQAQTPLRHQQPQSGEPPGKPAADDFAATAARPGRTARVGVKVYVPMGEWRFHKGLVAAISSKHPDFVQSGRVAEDFDPGDPKHSDAIADGIEVYAGLVHYADLPHSPGAPVQLDQTTAAAFVLRILDGLETHPQLPRPHERQSHSVHEDALTSHLRLAYDRNAPFIREALDYCHHHTDALARALDLPAETVQRRLTRYREMLNLPTPTVAATAPPPTTLEYVVRKGPTGAAAPKAITEAQAANRNILRAFKHQRGFGSSTMRILGRTPVSPGQEANVPLTLLVNSTTGEILHERGTKSRFEELRQQGQAVDYAHLRIFVAHTSEALELLKKRLLREGIGTRGDIPAQLLAELNSSRSAASVRFAAQCAIDDAARRSPTAIPQLEDLFVDRVKTVEFDMQSHLSSEVKAGLRKLEGARFNEPDAAPNSGGGPEGGDQLQQQQKLEQQQPAEIDQDTTIAVRRANTLGFHVTPDEAAFLGGYGLGQEGFVDTTLLGAITEPMAVDALIHKHRLLIQLGMDPESVDTPGHAISSIPLTPDYTLQLEPGFHESKFGMRVVLYQGHGRSEEKLATLGFQETRDGIQVVQYQSETLFDKKASYADFRNFSGGADPMPWVATTIGRILLEQAHMQGKNLQWISGSRILWGYEHEGYDRPEGIHTFDDARRVGTANRVQRLNDSIAEHLGFRRRGEENPWHRYTKDPAAFGSAVRHGRGVDTAHFDASVASATAAMQSDPVFAKWLSPWHLITQKVPGTFSPVKSLAPNHSKGARDLPELPSMTVAEHTEFIPGLSVAVRGARRLFTDHIAPTARRWAETLGIIGQRAQLSAEMVSGLATVAPKIKTVGDQDLLIIPPGHDTTPEMDVQGMPGIQVRWYRGQLYIRDMRKKPVSALERLRPRLARRIQTNEIPLLINGQAPDAKNAKKWYLFNYGDQVQFGHRVYTVAESPMYEVEIPEKERADIVQTWKLPPRDIINDPRAVAVWTGMMQTLETVDIHEMLRMQLGIADRQVPVDAAGWQATDDTNLHTTFIKFRDSRNFDVARRAFLAFGKHMYDVGATVMRPAAGEGHARSGFPTYEAFAQHVDEMLSPKPQRPATPPHPMRPAPVVPEPPATPPKPQLPTPLPHVSHDMRVHLAPFVKEILAAASQAQETQMMEAEETLTRLDAGRPPTMQNLRRWRDTIRDSGYDGLYINPSNSAVLQWSDIDATARWQQQFIEGVQSQLPEGVIAEIPHQEGRPYFVPANENWFWGGDWLRSPEESRAHPYHGRIPIAVDRGIDPQTNQLKAGILYAKLTLMARALKRQGIGIQFKISATPSDRSDFGMVYFEAKDQDAIHNWIEQINQFRLTKDRLPLFVAQLTDHAGNPMPGFGFAQHPKARVSFGARRTGALRESRHILKAEVRAGTPRPEREIEGILAAALDQAGIDPEVPAFDKGGQELFPYLRRYMRFSPRGERPTQNLDAERTAAQAKADAPPTPATFKGLADKMLALLERIPVEGAGGTAHWTDSIDHLTGANHLNARILQGDRDAIAEAGVFYKEEAESIGGNAGRGHMIILVTLDPATSTITAVGNPQNIPDNIHGRGDHLKVLYPTTSNPNITLLLLAARREGKNAILTPQDRILLEEIAESSLSFPMTQEIATHLLKSPVLRYADLKPLTANRIVEVSNPALQALVGIQFIPPKLQPSGGSTGSPQTGNDGKTIVYGGGDWIPDAVKNLVKGAGRLIGKNPAPKAVAARPQRQVFDLDEIPTISEWRRREYDRARDLLNRRIEPYVDSHGKEHRPADVLEAVVDLRREPSTIHFSKVPEISRITDGLLNAYSEYRPKKSAGDEPCVILDLDDLQAAVQGVPVARPKTPPRARPPAVRPPAARHSADLPEPTLSVYLEAAGLNPQKVKDWAVEKESGRIKRQTIIYAGAATVLASAAIAVVAMLFPKKDDDDEAQNATPLALSERSLAGVQKQIEVLTAQLQSISPTAGTDDDVGSDIEVRGRAMADARIYSKFIELRHRAMRKGERITVNDLETLLNKGGVTDLRARLHFYKLASGYFEQVATTQKRLEEIVDFNDKIPSHVMDTESIAKFVEREFGFTPKGKVVLLVRDIHIMVCFYDHGDYAAATAPHDPLWKKNPKDYNDEEKARLAGILQNGMRTSGASSGRGVTIRQGAESAEVLHHEEGHELDALGPYFVKGYNPWSGNSEIAQRLRSVSKDPNDERETIQQLMDFRYNVDQRYHFHTEFIQYLREGGRLSNDNPLGRGGIYDPLVRTNDENLLKARYAKHPQLRDYAVKLLHERYDAFYADADKTYDTLKLLDQKFEADEEFKDNYKAAVLSYLAIRGTRDWDLDFLRSLIP